MSAGARDTVGVEGFGGGTTGTGGQCRDGLLHCLSSRHAKSQKPLLLGSSIWLLLYKFGVLFLQGQSAACLHLRVNSFFHLLVSNVLYPSSWQMYIWTESYLHMSIF